MDKLSTYFIDLTKDATLKAFWRKPTLKTFLRQNKIPESHLSTWSLDGETKREYLSRLFDDLTHSRNKNGHIVILNIAISLVKMKSFPDLENWEDSNEKISSAYRAIEKLKIEVNNLNQKEKDAKLTQAKREKAQQERLRNIQLTQSLMKLQDELNNLTNLQGTTDGGFAFEKWFYDLLGYFEIPTRKPYKDKNNRQIDGSLTLDGTTFLIETKFTKNKIESPDIDVFSRKIHTKADNTMGVMISMSGFHDTAIKTACCDRTTVILMDYSHLYQIVFPAIMTLPDVIRRIWRNASQTGNSFLAVKDFSK